MARICPLFSGSTGNSTYIASPKGALLIDAGASFRALCTALTAAGGSIDEIKTVLITHEHSDHIKGLKTLLSKTGAAAAASEKTLLTLQSAGIIPAGTDMITLESEKITELSGFAVKRFSTLHDCEGSSGYTLLTADGRKISVCTDLGRVTDEVRNSLSGSEAVLIESNHDINMLKNGPYPPSLKIRILSDNGHISNNACAAELPELLRRGTKRFILGHLSRKNNSPLLALNAAEAALTDAGALNGTDYILTVAAPAGNGVTVV